MDRWVCALFGPVLIRPPRVYKNVRVFEISNAGALARVPNGCDGPVSAAPVVASKPDTAGAQALEKVASEWRRASRSRAIASSR